MSKIVKESFEDLVKQIKKHPELSEGTFEATSVLGKRLNVKSTSNQFEFHFDEPEVLGGENNAPNPVEYVLGSLGACQSIVYRALASLKGIKLEGVTVKTKGELNLKGLLGIDNETRPGFHKVQFETIIVSDEDPETLYRLSKQVEKLCPVLDIIAHPVDVSGKITIRTKLAEELAAAG